MKFSTVIVSATALAAVVSSALAGNPQNGDPPAIEKSTKTITITLPPDWAPATLPPAPPTPPSKPSTDTVKGK